MFGTGPMALIVTPYPAAWRLDVVDNDKHRGFEYIRFCWVTTDLTWTLANASKENGAKVVPTVDKERMSHRIWNLIPVKVEGAFLPSQFSSGTLGSGFPPSYDGAPATGQSSTHTRIAESERDEFGTIVTEVTTVTTRKRYRVEDAIRGSF
ncbi:hypothetical protein BJ322DRAFT_243563 [Thelephora terrestris]|uniref:Uncharacterized protein n=1 Tax=Thelephora terrestris TaxID=56493 RepID=A0A9P6L4D9_9AGAM|nr:hypothetical protein BJ322DRAFT_243563 [Thelephora terrestris]